MKPDPLAVIRIREFRLKAVIGTRPEERLAPQDIMADLSFEYDASLAAATDALGHAVDYAAVHSSIIEKAALTKFMLLERLAGFILDIVMEDLRVISAVVTLEKAGVLPGARSVAVTLSVKRSGQKVIPTTRCC